MVNATPKTSIVNDANAVFNLGIAAFFFPDSTILYNTGRTINVNKVAVSIPPITTVASGR